MRLGFLSAIVLVAVLLASGCGGSSSRPTSAGIEISATQQQETCAHVKSVLATVSSYPSVPQHVLHVLLSEMHGACGARR